MTAELRQSINARRRALPYHARQRSATSLKLAAINPLIQKLSARHKVGLYWPVQGELDPRPMAQHLARHWRITCWLPVLDEKRRVLVFKPWKPYSIPKSTNRFRIPEPKWGAPISIDELDILLMPLTAFDKKGHRIGMGGGWYDRSLARLKFAKRPYRVGIGYAWQEVANIKPASWDVGLHLMLAVK